jgi:hypothetical protein
MFATSRIFHIVALWLIVLSVSPFQAPFTACDFARPVGEGHCGDSLKTKITSDATLVSPAPACAPMRLEDASSAPIPADPVDSRPILDLVLRL